jgi:hypothetical protein
LLLCSNAMPVNASASRSTTTVVDVSSGSGNTAYDVSGGRAGGSPSSSVGGISPQVAPQPVSDSGGGDVEPVDYYLALVDGPEGPCIGWTSDAAQAISMTSAGTVLDMYEPCPAAEDEAVPPSVIAEVEVLRFWRSQPVPVMEPEIDPGWAITGLRAYLETGPDSVPATTLTVDTPVGTAELDVAADYVVDWGDGTAPESYPHVGGAWPDGQISHVYTHAETVTVTTTQVWGGTWRVVDGPAAGVAGGLPALPLSAALDLEVEQVQAVIH